MVVCGAHRSRPNTTFPIFPGGIPGIKAGQQIQEASLYKDIVPIYLDNR